ncbi:TPA: hypothetical protein J0U65_000609 [Enterococcus faecium]|nr:hypothetical protein [Enterococcus faecium]HBL1955395.1 hypothetical protein [Enterococcus faecium]HCD4358503.1 hypothetical protein [Enterococcus faecium]
MTNQKKAFAATIGCLLFMIFGFIFDRFSLTITPLFLYQCHYHRWI